MYKVYKVKIKGKEEDECDEWYSFITREYRRIQNSEFVDVDR
jgi:hypothetical protein